MKFNLLFLLFVYQLGYSQIWVNSLEDAKKVAKATNKLILLDFTAKWCKPCKMMEMDFWYNPQYKSTLDKFIIVPIDIDNNRDLARFYNARMIPNVKLVDIDGNIIHENLGFDNPDSFNKQFEGFPESSEDLYESLSFKDKKNPTDEEFLNLATSYQVLLQKSKNKARTNFFKLSNLFFNKCLKNTINADYKESSELGKFFNLALTDSGDKVIKNLEISQISNKNRPYAHYILAKAYYQKKNKAEAEKNIIEVEKTNDQYWISAAKILQLKYNQ